MKRRIVFNNLSTNMYDSLDDMFEEVTIGNNKIEQYQYNEKEQEKEKEKGCFAGFLGFLRFFVKK